MPSEQPTNDVQLGHGPVSKKPRWEGGDSISSIRCFTCGVDSMAHLQEVAALRKSLEAAEAERDYVRQGLDAVTIHRNSSIAEFKAFHKSLCERFGLHHDDADWRRDQVSLIEFIAADRDEAKADLLRLIAHAIGAGVDAAVVRARAKISGVHAVSAIDTLVLQRNHAEKERDAAHARIRELEEGLGRAAGFMEAWAKLATPDAQMMVRESMRARTVLKGKE